MSKIYDKMISLGLSIGDNELGTDKDHWHSYIELLYPHVFDNIVPLDLVYEIGVWNKASLALWKSSYPSARVIGCDINLELPTHPIASEMIKNGEIELLEGDPYENIDLLLENISILIDDGPHTIASQKRALDFRIKLAPHGILVIEDLVDLGGPVNCFYELYKSINRSERKYCLAIDFSKNKSRLDDAVFIYTRDPKIFGVLSKELSEYIFTFKSIIHKKVKASFSYRLRKFLSLKFNS